MSLHRVTIYNVRTEDLNTLIGCLYDYKLTVAPMNEADKPPAPRPAAKPKRSMVAGAARPSRTRDIILSALAGGPKNAIELGAALQGQGYSPNSVSPAVSTLLRMIPPKIVKGANGAYSLSPGAK